MRLQKYLASCGVASRRQAETLISAGRVRIDDKMAQLGDAVDPDICTVTLDGRVLRPGKHVYVLLNKPPGVLSTVKDTHKRRTVIDCVAGIEERVFPVGRLDIDVEGAMILTNDGELAHRLMHPKFQIDKTYLAWVEGAMQVATARKLATGVDLEDGPTSPAEATILETRKGLTLLRLVLREGRKREAKRMCAAVNHPVVTLQRVSVGTISIEGLQPGEWRYLTEEEVNGLKRLTGLST